MSEKFLQLPESEQKTSLLEYRNNFDAQIFEEVLNDIRALEQLINTVRLNPSTQPEDAE